MIRYPLSFAFLLFTLWSNVSAESRFMKYPDINGDKIVFTFEGDLWLSDVNGSSPRRITSHPGEESSAKFSKDGSMIAFSGDYDGYSNVYVIPSGGGVPKRIVYNAGSQVINWSPDGKKVIFRNSFESTYRGITKLWSVSPEGEMPEALPVPKGILCSFSPDGKQMAYNPRGREEYYWKRYKGGQFIELWLYDFGSKSFTKLTDYVGKNAYPMWINNDIFFISDRGDGISNIYKYNVPSKQITQVTFHKDFDVQMPSTDGKKIIYMNAGYIYIFNPSDNSTKKITVNASSDEWKFADRIINPSGFIQSFDVSNDGKTAIFEARGDVFSVPVKDNGDNPLNFTNTNDSRERFPQLSPDGKKVAFFSDKTGDYDLYIKDADTGNQDWEKLVNLDRTVYHLIWSPDGKKILYESKDFNLYYVDVESKKVTLVDTSRQLKNDQFYWEVSDYTWSPDGKWIAYSFVQYNRNNQIFLFNTETNKRYPLTGDFYDCMNPAFDANGDMLYFLSYRDYSVQMDIFEDNHVINHPVQIMAVQLRSGEKPPFRDDSYKAEKTDFRIDINGIQDRIFKVPVQSGNYFYLKAGKGKITYASIDGYDGGEYRGVFSPRAGEKWDLNIFDIKDKKVSTLKDKISDWKVSSNGEWAIIKKSSDYYVKAIDGLDGDKGLKDKINLSKMTYPLSLGKEYAQIFNDVWRWYRDFFYDPGFHGRDWKQMGDKFRALLPDIRSRQDLNWLLSQMVGELCVSHTYIGGGDYFNESYDRSNVFTGVLGCDFSQDKDGYYHFSKIFGPTEFNPDARGPLSYPDKDIKEGDCLIAINGQKLKYPDNIYKYLQVTPGQKIRLTFAPEGSPSKTKEIDIEPVRGDWNLRYDRWIADNINKIRKDSEGEIGYMHLTAMGDQNVGQFDKYWRAFRYKKGLIIDVRGNGGGWTEFFMIDKLERKMVAYNCVKNMELFRYPGSTSNAKIVVISNEYNGSDGEAFIEHFKARKLGTVIGVPSWGGLVGILNTQTTVDNGSVEQSNNAFYGRQGKWLVENHGADPDILIENDAESLMIGQDKQLDKAIEVLKEQIKADPFTFPPKPDYPKK